MKRAYMYLVLVWLLQIGCIQQREISGLYASFNNSELPSVHSDSITGFNYPKIIVDSEMFAGVAGKPVITCTGKKCIPLIVYNKWLYNYSCYTGYDNLSVAIFMNMRVCLTNKLSKMDWTTNSNNCLVRVKIDSVTSRMEYSTGGYFIALGGNSIAYRPFVYSGVALTYDLIKGGDTIRSDRISKSISFEEGGPVSYSYDEYKLEGLDRCYSQLNQLIDACATNISTNAHSAFLTK